MKKFYFLTTFIFLSAISFASSTITAVTNLGRWASNSTWDLNRQPSNGDIVIIPNGITVLIDNNQNISSTNLTVNVFGALDLSKSGSKLTIGSNSLIWIFSLAHVQGTGSPSQTISIGGVIVFQGTQSFSGPAMIDANGFHSGQSPLPVKFVGFTVTHQNNDVLVQWSTSEEINASMYQVERSLDGTNWSTIAYVVAAGNSSSTSNYSFTDKNLSSKIAYYRIKEADRSGQTTYTSIKSIKTETTSASEVRIASIQRKVLLQFSQEIKGNLTVRFVSANGQVVDQQIINNPVGQIVLNSKVTGNYIISVSNGQNINTAKQVIL